MERLEQAAIIWDQTAPNWKTVQANIKVIVHVLGKRVAIRMFPP